jgi:prephenate dehydratase
MKRFVEIQNEVIAQYRIKLDEHSSCKMRTHAHVKERRICKWHQKNSVASTFELFHEIGHVETTTGKMRRCEAEYHATIWALEKAHEYGLEIPERIIKDYQEYIDMELARGIRRHGTGYDTDMRLIH